MHCAVQLRCPLGLSSLLQSSSCSRHRSVRLQRPFTCSAQQPRKDQSGSSGPKFALPVAAALAAALIMSAGSPDEALAARSGGRVGGSSFRSARPAPSQGGSSQSGPTVRNYNYHSYSAPPPLYGGGYGGGYGFGGGGITFMPSFGVPIIGGGSFFSLIFGLFAISLVLSIVKNLTSRGRRDDDFYD